MNTEKFTTIARPYAVAAFEYALAKSDLSAWENMLRTAAEIAEDKDMARLLDSPKVTQKELVGIFCDILAPMLDAEKKNFISLLAEYERLIALPEIANLFAMYRAQYEKTITVQVTSAMELNDSYQQKFIQTLTMTL